MTRNLLIDGTNLAHVHFAANPTLDDNGTPAGIIKGFMNAVSVMNKKFMPRRIVAFFDGPGGSLQRRRIHKGYKEGRKTRVSVGQHYQFTSPEEARDNYNWQVSHLYDLLNACAVNVIETENYETDDGIAFTVSEYLGEDQIIVSCDKDFYQLVDDNVKIYNPISKTIVDTNAILSKWEVHPKNWLFYRAITGDKSDNIDGVKGFGPKTIKKMFSLDKKESVSLSSIGDAAAVLNEIKLGPKEKRIKKRLDQLLVDKDKIERNWTLMDLREPLISNDRKRSIRWQLDSFKPTTGTKTFFEKVSQLNIPLNPMMAQDFVGLTI